MVSSRPDGSPAGGSRCANFGLIDPRNFGSIDFGVVGPKRAGCIRTRHKRGRVRRIVHPEHFLTYRRDEAEAAAIAHRRRRERRRAKVPEHSRRPEMAAVLPGAFTARD